MNDARIEQLLRMAVEADDLEDACEGRSPVIARLHNGKVTMVAARRRMWAGMALAACAALAFAGAWVIGVRSGTPRTQGDQTAATPSGVEATNGSTLAGRVEPNRIERDGVPQTRVELVSADAAGPDQNMVLAIYHDPYAGCRCVKWRSHDWSENRCLSEVGAQEIKGVDVGRPCMPSAQQKLLVALSGPARDLPNTDAKASALAQCILDADRPCDAEGTCYEPAARECVPKNVSFKIEAVAYNR